MKINHEDNKLKYIELAKKILQSRIDNDKTLGERMALEDQLVELGYQIASEFELTPEEFDNLRDIKRAKAGILKSLEEESKSLMKATKKDELMEKLGDILEVVETYTARF